MLLSTKCKRYQAAIYEGRSQGRSQKRVKVTVPGITLKVTVPGITRVIRDEPEIHPGNLEERGLFLTVSLGDLPMYPNIVIGFFSTPKAKPHKGDTSQAKNPYSLQKIVFNCPK